MQTMTHMENQKIMTDYAFLEDEIHDIIDEQASGEWSITDDKAADWAIEEIKYAKEEYDRLADIANQKIQFIHDQLEKEKGKYERQTTYLKAKLSEYFNGVKHKKTKTQESYQLLSGKLVKKLGGFKAVYDEEALLNHLKHEGLFGYIKTTEKISWGEYKKRLALTEAGAIDTETGEKVEVIDVEKQPDIFDVKF